MNITKQRDESKTSFDVCSLKHLTSGETIFIFLNKSRIVFTNHEAKDIEITHRAGSRTRYAHALYSDIRTESTAFGAKV